MLDVRPGDRITNYCQKTEVSVADASEKWLDFFRAGLCVKSNVFNSITLTSNFFYPESRGKKIASWQMKNGNDYIFEALDAEALESARN